MHMICRAVNIIKYSSKRVMQIKVTIIKEQEFIVIGEGLETFDSERNNKKTSSILISI